MYGFICVFVFVFGITWQNLVSVLMSGVEESPLEGGLFEFQISLPETYPKDFPTVAYIGHELESGQLSLNIPENGLVDLRDMFEDTSDLNLSTLLPLIRGKPL